MELKNKITEFKDSLDRINSRLDIAGKKKNSNLGNRPFEIIIKRARWKTMKKDEWSLRDLLPSAMPKYSLWELYNEKREKNGKGTYLKK